jgi:hypothetical protein
MEFLLEWHPVFSIAFLSAISVLISYLALKLVRRRFSEDVLRENHEVGGIIFNSFGLIYAVLVAFVVFVTWSEYDTSERNIELEASELADLYNLAKAYPWSTQSKIKEAISEYTNSVIYDEWPLMATGKVSEKTLTAYHRIWDTFTLMDLSNVTNMPIYQESLAHINHLGEKRRSRIFDSRDDIPGIIWGVLLFGSIMIIIFTYFFRTKQLAAQFLMTTALAIFNTLILYMIYCLDHPFTGWLKIHPDALNYVQGLITGHY